MSSSALSHERTLLTDSLLMPIDFSAADAYILFPAQYADMVVIDSAREISSRRRPIFTSLYAISLFRRELPPHLLRIISRAAQHFGPENTRISPPPYRILRAHAMKRHGAQCARLGIHVIAFQEILMSGAEHGRALKMEKGKNTSPTNNACTSMYRPPFSAHSRGGMWQACKDRYGALRYHCGGP